MGTQPEQQPDPQDDRDPFGPPFGPADSSFDPDPSTLYIHRLGDDDAFHREAAAWTLGELGASRAARPLAGLLLREIETVERTGYLHHVEVVRAASEAIRRIGAGEALYALFKALCVLAHARLVDETTIEEIVETIGVVGGPTAVREAADRVARETRELEHPDAGLDVVARVLLTRLSLCGDAAVRTLHRLANGPSEPLRPHAEQALAAL